MCATEQHSKACCPTQKSRTRSKTWGYIFQRRDEYGRYRKWVLPSTSKIAVSKNIFPSTPTRFSDNPSKFISQTRMTSVLAQSQACESQPTVVRLSSVHRAFKAKVRNSKRLAGGPR